MAKVAKVFQELISSPLKQNLLRKTRFDYTCFAEGDRVYINGKKPKFSKPLQAGSKLDLADGFIPHDEIIGGRPNQTFRSNRGKAYRITYPDIDIYIKSMPRKVTPVYSTYASYIVSLFDIHVPPPHAAEDTQQPLEILDAGTGHGSVTLHLARAVQAANPPIPDVDLAATASSSQDTTQDCSEATSSISDDEARVWRDWRQSRRAIVHSVEISRTYSKHAEKKVVAGFRRGLYLPHIDFHVANVYDWIDEQLEKRRHKPFLSYVFLDMPSCHLYLQKVVTATKDDALIAVFVPSITQIGDCVREIKANILPLRMEKVIELGDGISNGRLWDVRLAFKKAKDPIEESSTIKMGENVRDEQIKEGSTPIEDSSPPSEDEGGRGSPFLDREAKESVANEAPVMVCRPKVGEMVVGGGFVGLWRRIIPDR